MQTITYKQSLTGELLWICTYAMCGVTVVAAVITDVANDRLVDSIRGHTSDQMFR